MRIEFWLSRSSQQLHSKTLTIQHRKFDELNPTSERLAPDDVIQNLLSYTLSKSEKEALALGLNYAFHTTKVSKIDWNTYIECFGRQLFQQPIWNGQNWHDIKVDLLRVADSCKLSQHQSNKQQLKILKTLAQRKDLIILKPDKGNGVVLWNKSDYVKKMNIILSDGTKFETVNEDYWKLVNRLERQLNKCLLDLNHNNILD